MGVRGSLATATATAAMLAWVAASCSTAESLQGSGGRCFLVTDCQEGLACVLQANGTKVCTNNLAPIVMPADAGVPADATTPDGTSDALPADVTAPDDTSPSPDVGPTPDTSTPMPDTGSPAPDTGSPAPDTGSPAPDTGAPAMDTGAPAPDTGAE